MRFEEGESCSVGTMAVLQRGHRGSYLLVHGKVVISAFMAAHISTTRTFSTSHQQHRDEETTSSRLSTASSTVTRAQTGCLSSQHSPHTTTNTHQPDCAFGHALSQDSGDSLLVATWFLQMTADQALWRYHQ